MFRNQYDTDVTVWSPQGRLHQVEYAMEVVNQVSIGVQRRHRRLPSVGSFGGTDVATAGTLCRIYPTVGRMIV